MKHAKDENVKGIGYVENGDEQIAAQRPADVPPIVGTSLFNRKRGRKLTANQDDHGSSEVPVPSISDQPDIMTKYGTKAYDRYSWS